MGGQGILSVGPKRWWVSLATSYTELARGLGGIHSIPPWTGMLFDMGRRQPITVSTHSMLFALDVVFIDNMQVVGVVRNVLPGHVVESGALARYFLEVNADECVGVGVGDSVSYQGQTLSAQAVQALFAWLPASIIAMAVVPPIIQAVRGRENDKSKRPHETRGCNDVYGDDGEINEPTI